MDSANKTVKIFHTGDFHLDSPFSGYDVKQSELRRAELRNAFSNALSRAKADGCDIILISGDLFDCGYVTVETVSRIFSAIEKVGLPVVIAPGNHDPYVEGGIYSKKNLPENLYIFNSNELTCFDFENLGIAVFGYAFTSDRLDSSPVNSGITLKNDRINILCAHGDIDSPLSKYAPINPLAIETSGLDYVALGHIHKPRKPVLLGSSTVAYCGFPEGRGFDELGFGSALEVTLTYGEKGRAEIERVILSMRRYALETLDITGAYSISDILPSLSALIKNAGYGKETSLRVVLQGAVSPDMPNEINLNAEDFSLSLLEIENETLPIYDSEYLKEDFSLRGALYRELVPKLQSSDESERKIAAEALKIGLYALDGKDFN